MNDSEYARVAVINIVAWIVLIWFYADKWSRRK